MAKFFEISAVIKGVLIAAILSLGLTLLLSIIYYFTSLQESLIHSLIIIGLSVLVASFYVAFRSGSKGLFYGLTIGSSYFLLNLLIYYIFYEGDPSWKTILVKLAFSLFPGAIGGTVGVILKK
ncbi:MAG TPA: TIGR04086 family membrane protein [Peptococcaceae bacterium]|nr:TIGR04086 family membrane protein [Peptococcaceae bacterium]